MTRKEGIWRSYEKAAPGQSISGRSMWKGDGERYIGQAASCAAADIVQEMDSQEGFDAVEDL